MYPPSSFGLRRSAHAFEESGYAQGARRGEKSYKLDNLKILLVLTRYILIYTTFALLFLSSQSFDSHPQHSLSRWLCPFLVTFVYFLFPRTSLRLNLFWSAQSEKPPRLARATLSHQYVMVPAVYEGFPICRNRKVVILSLRCPCLCPLILIPTLGSRQHEIILSTTRVPKKTRPCGSIRRQGQDMNPAPPQNSRSS